MARQWQSVYALLLPCNRAGRKHWQCQGNGAGRPRGALAPLGSLHWHHQTALWLQISARTDVNWEQMDRTGKQMERRKFGHNLKATKYLVKKTHIMGSCLNGRQAHGQVWVQSWNKRDAKGGQNTATVHRQVMTHSNLCWHTQPPTCWHTLVRTEMDVLPSFEASEANNARHDTGQICAGDTCICVARTRKDYLIFCHVGKGGKTLSLKQPVLDSFHSGECFLVVYFT